MGLFDYVVCEAPLPDGFDVPGYPFQTKYFDDPYLNTYTITEDGRLLFCDGSTKETTEVPLHGDLDFGGCNISQSGPDGIGTDDDSPPWSREYVARFTNGRLERITGGIDPDAFAGRVHRSRAELNRLWRERHEVTP